MSFDIISYKMGQKASSGGGITPADNGKVVVNGALVSQTARSVTENGTFDTTTNNSVTVDVPSAPVVDESKPIRFYDYDGTPLYSYTLAELQALTELPAQPEHPGLTATGWNWTLADIKAENAPVVVGGHYRTTDGKHKFYIHIENDDQRKIDLYFRLQGTAEVNWGDGSNTETITWNMALVAVPPLFIHEYAQTGDYCISINVLTGKIAGAYSNEPLLKYAYREDLITTQSGDSISANALLTRIEGGNDDVDYAWFNAFIGSRNLRSIAVPSKKWFLPDSSRATSLISCNSLQFLSFPYGLTQTQSFSYCYQLKNVSIPCSVTDITNNIFMSCTSIERVVIPSSVTSLGNNTFNGASSLKDITIPNNVTSIKQGTFQECKRLTSLTIPGSVTSIGNQAFNTCTNLTSLTIPDSVTNIGNQAFSGCKNIRMYDFTGWTIANLDACTFGTNIFQNLLARTQIVFKYKSVADHAATITNLSTYVAYMTYEEDDT